jgi:FtsP/CotA-like multicopper oxidase with cupredoxin domain
MRRTRTLVASVLAMVGGLVLVSAPAADAATVTVDLCARPGSVTMPDATVVPIWGYAPGACAAGNPATLPGPVVTAAEGDTLVVNLHVDASMPEAVSLVVPNLDGAPDTSGAAPGATATYTFAGLDPGTYLYESGANATFQVPMGLHGALVVHAADTGTVYGAGTGTGFDVESPVVLSELDLDLNSLANPNDFVMNGYAPDYFLINGAAYPDTDVISAAAGDDVALRYVNAGLLNHSMRVLGLHQRVVGRESHQLVGKARDVVAELLAAGEVAETIVTVPSGASPGTRFAVSTRNGRLTNNRITGGGMLTFIETAEPPPGPPLLPLSFTAPGTAGSVTFGDEDVVTHSDAFSLAFDGSAEGLAANADVDALEVLGPGHVLLSFERDAGTRVPDGIGVVDDSDVVEFDDGTFTLFFDGSDVGLTTNAEDVDAIELLASGTLAVSTDGDPAVPGVSSPAPRDEDLLRFSASTLGATTAGTWTLWFDGSDVGLAQTGEDTDGAAIGPDGELLLSTRGSFTVAGLSGADEDVFACSSPVFGSVTSCTFSSTLRFDGSALGVTAASGGDGTNNVDGIG